jgi:hypothetical protein
MRYHYSFNALIVAFFAGAVFTIIVIIITDWLLDRRKPSRQQVVDAYFVDIPDDRPKLSSSQALVRRSTSLTVNRDNRLTRRDS